MIRMDRKDQVVTRGEYTALDFGGREAKASPRLREHSEERIDANHRDLFIAPPPLGALALARSLLFF